MSAETEAAVANPTTAAPETDSSNNVKAEEVQPVDGNSEKKDAEVNEEANKNGSKPDKESAHDVDDKYSKDKGDRRGDRSGFRGKRDSNYNNRGRNSYNRDKFDRRNVKSRYDHQQQTDDPAQIRKQVEFYFSDGNLLQDKFLYQQTGGSANKPVDIKLLHSFKRMQRFSPYSAIVDALKESSTLDVLNTETRGEEQVRRKTALADNHSTDHKDVRANYEAASMKRSIYVKGFGEEDEKTQLKIEELFGVYGVTSVRLRRTVDGSFKGSAFIEFPSEDEQKQFLEQDDDAKPRWNDDEPLKIMSKEAYCRQKEDDINAGKIRANGLDPEDDGAPRRHQNNRDRDGNFRGRGRGRGRGSNFRGGDRGHRNNRDRRDRRDRSRSQSGGPSDLENENWGELRDKGRKPGRGKDDRKEKEEEKEEKKPVQEYDEVGIPKLMTSESNGSKKRPAEDEGENKEAKKAKEDE